MLSGPSETIIFFFSALSNFGLNTFAYETCHAHPPNIQGSVVVESKKEWAPNGVIRLYTMVSSGFFSNGAYIIAFPFI